MVTSFTNLSSFFHETYFIINTLLSYPCERRCTPLTQNSLLKVTTFLESRNNAADFLHGHSLFTGMACLADFSQYFDP